MSQDARGPRLSLSLCVPSMWPLLLHGSWRSFGIISVSVKVLARDLTLIVFRLEYHLSTDCYDR